jgi:hypothetical protein
MARNHRTSVSQLHCAPGQAAGYLFQPERALHWLAVADADAKVGIETDDDVAVAVRGGITVREQLKHTTSTNVPFGDRSSDLWKTLTIWLDAAAKNEFDPNKCSLILTTNATLGDCFVKRLVACKRNKGKIKNCLDDLLSPDIPFPDSIDAFVQRVKEHDSDLVAMVLARIDLCDGSIAAGTGLRRQIASALHLPADVQVDEVIDGLLGWIHSSVLEAWRLRKPAWIKREAFDNRFHRLIRTIRRYQQLGLPARLINVPPSERMQQLNRLYVRQLRIINAEQQEILMAVDDYYRCSSERFRLANEGDVTADDWIDFEDRLTQQWQIVAYREQRVQAGRDPIETGYATYSSTIEFHTKLAFDEPQPYLTRGTYHRLANELTVGWHPNYESLCTP